jgi:hypothetical protein
MVEVGIAEYFGMAEALGIIGTMFVVLYFSRKQMQSLSVDVQTKVLNDLDEKVRKMAEIIIEKPSMQKVIYKLENPSDELAFAYYILFICSNAYAMRQRKVLNDDDWTGWLQWMRNCELKNKVKRLSPLAYRVLACDIPFFSSSKFIARWNSTLAPSPIKSGSAKAGIWSALCISTTNAATLSPPASKKYAASGLALFM